jgi:hypothetical protein
LYYIPLGDLYYSGGSKLNKENISNKINFQINSLLIW